MLPEWPEGTAAILATAGDAPHAIPVSTCLRAGDDRVRFALAPNRTSLARLRDDPRAALLLLAGEDVAVTVHGAARVVADPLPGAEPLVALELVADDVQDHMTPTFTIDAGVSWRWTDDAAAARDANARAALARLP